MKKTVISHFYNEEYLLPWWLNHHKKYFDHGIMINYASTDNSVNIIKDICPGWDIIDSRNEMFAAEAVDTEVIDIERTVSGWKTALNVTEFLVGNYSLLDTINIDTQFLIRSLYFVDDTFNRESIDHNVELYKQLTSGIDCIGANFNIRSGRSLHNFNVNYGVGRHYNQYNTDEFVIFSYGFSPMTPEFKTRKLQIQNKIPHEDKVRGFGAAHHNFGNGLDESSLLEFYSGYLNRNTDLTDIMNKYLTLMEN